MLSTLYQLTLLETSVCETGVTANTPHKSAAEPRPLQTSVTQWQVPAPNLYASVSCSINLRNVSVIQLYTVCVNQWRASTSTLNITTKQVSGFLNESSFGAVLQSYPFYWLIKKKSRTPNRIRSRSWLRAKTCPSKHIRKKEYTLAILFIIKVVLNSHPKFPSSFELRAPDFCYKTK